MVAHTQASKLLAENEAMRDAVGMANEEHLPAYTKVPLPISFPSH